jgi:hypothetical protein
MTSAIRTTDEVMCPKCGGRTWDNRATKRNPKAPDYKCRDRACDGAVWPPKGQQNAQPAQVKQGFSSGPALPGEQPTLLDKVDELVALYSVCLGEAMTRAQTRREDGYEVTGDTIAAMTSTLFIQAAKRA